MLDRTVAPASKPIRHISIKEAEQHPVSSGIDLFVLNAGTQPVIKFEIIIESGKWHESKPGASFFTGKMLREGSKSYSSYQISNLFDSLGGHLEVTPSLDYTSITVYSLSRYIPQLLPVVKSILLEPHFPDTELETLKNIQIQKLKVNNQKNSYVATKKFRELIFGPTHPYGQIMEQSEMQALDRSDLAEHFNKSITAKPITLVASGQISDDTIRIISDEFNGIAAEDYDQLSHEPWDSTRKFETIEKSESSQSSLRVGGLTIPMGHPDYPKLVVTNEIFGGYFGSRLMKNVREDKGLTYGIYSTIVSLKHNSYIAIGADVKKEFRTEAIREILGECKKMREEQVENEELDTVRNYLLGQIQASVNTPFALASKFKNIYFNGLTYDYYRNLIETIQQITPEEVQDTAIKYLKEDAMTQVCVG